MMQKRKPPRLDLRLLIHGSVRISKFVRASVGKMAVGNLGRSRYDVLV